MIKLVLIALAVFTLNIPFGYWRAHVKHFSLQWFVAIHMPVILVILLRLGSHLGFAWYTYAALVTAFFLGQQLGAFLIKMISRKCGIVTSCLVMDLVRCKAT